MAEKANNITIELDLDSAAQLENALRNLSSTIATNAGAMIHVGAYSETTRLLSYVNVATNFCQALKEQREAADAD